MKRFLFLFLTNWGLVTALGQTTNHLSIGELQDVRLPDVKLDSVKVLNPGRNAEEHLQVMGTIGGDIRFELLLPAKWNGRFVMGGGGGFVGSVQNGARDSVRHGYATVGTDAGHESDPGYMAGWAIDNLEAQLNFGYLAVHRTAETAKALIRAYYRTEPAYSYFAGCSRGGGQAMMESQRYPNDFDGIVAGAPAFNWTGIGATMVSIAKALYPDPKHLDSTVLTREALEKLQRGIVEQAQAQGAMQDGVIEDPRKFHFDLSKVADLNDEQRKAIEAIYRGAWNSKGQIAPGFTPGAECDPNQWMAWLVGPVPGLGQHIPDLTFAFGTQVFKGLVFNNPDWDYSKYDFENFEKDTRLPASFLNATNSNLDAFKARNGKLIIWHGWADPALPPQATIDYFRQVLAHDSQASDYCRLFMIPGCLHCGGGPGATDVDWLKAIVDWVEHGKAPDMLTANKKEQGKIVASRPLLPYSF